MAPGVDGLPVAERDVDVAGPVAEFLTSVSPRLLTRVKLGLRAFEWLPFPWRFSRLAPAEREDFLVKLEGSRFPLHHDLLLMAKLFSTLGYAVTPEVEAADRLRDLMRDRGRQRARAGRLARRPRAGRQRRGMRRRDRRLGRRRRGRRGDPGRVRARRAGTRGGRALQPRELSERPPRGDLQPLPRRRPDDRRRPAADPRPGRQGRRRDHGDQLGYLLPGAGAGAGGLAHALRDRLGARSRRLLLGGRRVPPRHPA